MKNLLREIFGDNTSEYDQYSPHITELDRAGFGFGEAVPVSDVIASVTSSVEDAITHLNVIKDDFREKLEDSGRGATARPLKAYEGLDLHKSIERAAGKLYRDGHYANAIGDAVKALNNLVRLNSGVENKDGMTLMQHVFSPNAPILKFNDLISQSDIDEQKGFMMMFSGAVAGLRNPRAHELIQDDAERSLEFIAFVSLLAKLCDEARPND